MISHTVIYHVSPCSYCSDETTYSLQLHCDGRITRSVTGCGGYEGSRYKADGQDVSPEEAQELLREREEEVREKLDQYAYEKSCVSSAICALEERKQEMVQRQQFNVSLSLLLTKYPTRKSRR